MYNTRSRGRVVLSGSARTHQRARVIMPPSNVTPSQALDILMSEEMVPDTEMSRSEYLIASERSDRDHDDNVNIDNVDENGTTSMECIYVGMMMMISPQKGYN